jgi:hypothetical protein
MNITVAACLITVLALIRICYVVNADRSKSCIGKSLLRPGRIFTLAVILFTAAVGLEIYAFSNFSNGSAFKYISTISFVYIFLMVVYVLAAFLYSCIQQDRLRFKYLQKLLHEAPTA